jgi:glycine oxidase
MQGFARVPSVTGVTTLDVAVVGGGVVGAACARALALRHLSVGVFEPGPLQGAASPASAGMLAAQIEASDEAWLALATRARDRYPALAAELQAATGQDVGLQRDGIAAVAFDAARAAELRELARRHRAAGLRAEWLEPADVARRWHGAAPGCAGAFFAPDDGAIAPPALTAALLTHAIQRGTLVIGARVERVSHRAGRVEGVVTGPRVVAARHVVLAAGAWSPGIAGLPRALPVVPVRGQIALAPWPAGMPAAILYHDHGYVLRRGDSALVGSTMEHAGFDARVTSEGQAAILAGARRLLPALNGVTRGAWAGLRPVTPDGLPLLGADPELDGLWYATGHGRNGILLAALTGDVIADLISTGVTSVDVSLFDPTRFTHAP